MNEYIDLHGAELLSERIPNHAFAFISMDFVNPDDHLEEIATDTAVNGTAITVFEMCIRDSSRRIHQELFFKRQCDENRWRQNANRIIESKWRNLRGYVFSPHSKFN